MTTRRMSETTLTALFTLAAVGACADAGSEALDPAVDEATIAEIQAALEDRLQVTIAHTRVEDPAAPSGYRREDRGSQRTMDADLDEEWIRRYARGERRLPWADPLPILSDPEIDILLDRMRAAEEAVSKEEAKR